MPQPHEIKIYVNIDGQWVSVPEAQSSKMSNSRMEQALISISAKLGEVAHNINSIRKREKKIMATLDELKAKVQTMEDKVDALNTALDGYREAVATLKQQLADLQSGATLPPPVQAKVDEIATSLDEATAAVDATFAENFPAVEPPPVVPEV